MKNRMKKLTGILLSVLLVLGLTACGGNDAKDAEGTASAGGDTAAAGQEDVPGADSSEEPYEVRMVITLPAASPSQSEIDRVVEKVNEITMEKLNMTLKLELLPFASYLEQIPLELSSNSDIDLLTSITGYAQSWVNSGYLVDLKPLLEEYGQDIIGTYSSEELAMACNLNGFVYGLPVHKEIAQQATVFFRTDILEKHQIDVSGVETIADVDAIFEQVAELEPDMWMLAADNTGLGKTVICDYSVGGTARVALMDLENSTTVEDLLSSDEFYEWCEYNHKWFENGWINPGAASDTESFYSYIQSGQAFAFFSDYGHPLSEADQEANCGGVDLTMVTMGEPYATTSTAGVFSYSISSGSKNPAKAMQMLNLIMTDTDIMNLLNWGVEGEDYIVNEDGLLDYPEGKDASTVGYHLGAGWILPNQVVCTPWVTDGADIYEKIIAYNDTAVISKAMGHNFDPAPVQDEIAAVNNATEKYYKALIVGAIDPAEYIPIMKEEREAAGLQTIIDEAQRQLDAYLESK